MFKPLQKRILFLVASFSLLILSTAHAEPPAGRGGGNGGGGDDGDVSTGAYTIVPFLPPDFTSTGSIVEDLNEQGQAVGYAELEDGSNQAIHLDADTGVYTSLTGGRIAAGVNNLNQIVGEIRIGEVSRAAFWSEPDADPVELPPLPGDVNSWPYAFNDDGIVVGSSHDGDTLVRGVVWRVVVDEIGGAHVDGPVPLILPEDATDSLAIDVGETVDGAAVVAGDVVFDNSLTVASVWLVELDPENGAVVATEPPIGLGTLGLATPSESAAFATSTFGDVCGNSDGLPCIAPAGESVQPLPVPRDTQWGRAMDVNNLGEVVGQLDIYKTKGFISGPGNYHAYIWRNGEMIDLEKEVDLGDWDRLWAASVINDGGVIAGFGRYDAEFRGFLMVPDAP